MSGEWKDFDWGCCGACGSDDCETLTEQEPPYHADGDIIRCKQCGELGQIVCDTETPAEDLWNGRDGMAVEFKQVKGGEV
jgi:hypothetical protein